MEAFDDEIDKDYIIKLLSEAYAARLSKNVYRIEDIERLLKEDLLDAVENSDRKPLHFNVSLEHIAKNITGNYLIEEKAEIHKVSKSIFDEELDEESQRYLQKSLEDWKSRITENIEKQYEDRYKKWKEAYKKHSNAARDSSEDDDEEEDSYDLYGAIDNLDKKAILRFIDEEVDKQNGKEPEQRKTWRWRK